MFWETDFSTNIEVLQVQYSLRDRTGWRAEGLELQ